MLYYTLYTLDVWGNQEDGYDVNDSFSQGTIALPDGFTDNDLLKAIADKIGLSNPQLAQIEDHGEFIEVTDKTNGIPVFHLYYDNEPEFTYHIDLNERGSFQAHVEDYSGNVVFEFSNADSEDGTLSLVEDGYMRHIEDVSGLEKYLISLGILPKNASLKKE
jgi:hypothetical protein